MTSPSLPITQLAITQLGYAGFEVSNLARWERFASEVLGLAVLPGASASSRYLRMDENRYRIILIEGAADDLAFAGWQAPNARAVQACSERLTDLGVAWSWCSDDELALRGVDRMLHFNDPVGNRHEIYCGPPLASTRFVSPAVASGFVTGPEGLGHLVYSSSDYAKSVDFAHDVLGLSDSDKIRVKLGTGATFEVSFMHLNARHHSFAVAPQPPFPGPHKKIHHFMIETKLVEEVGFARDRCLAMGCAVSMDIGQHPNDRMISFYGQTPSGFFVEFGWGGQKVEREHWQFVVYDKMSEWGHRPNPEVALQRPAATASPTNPPEKPMSASGEWNVVIKTPMGDDQAVFDLQQEGSNLHGAVKSDKETVQIFDGRVERDELRWGATVSFPIPMTLEFSATIDGNSITGGAKSPFGTAPFSGQRA